MIFPALNKPSAAAVIQRLSSTTLSLNTNVTVDAIDLNDYDKLLETTEGMDYEQKNLKSALLQGLKEPNLSIIRQCYEETAPRAHNDSITYEQ